MRSRLIRWLLPAVLIGVMGVGAAMAATATMGAGAATVKTAKVAKFGTVLVAANGRTLYRFTHDTKGRDTCTANAACNKAWPRLLVSASAKPTAGPGVEQALLGTIKQAGGKAQVTYAGYPLYFYAGDRKAGQVNGQGVESAWYVVNGKGALVKKAVAGGGTTNPPATPTTTGTGGGGGGGWG